jgi:hypothetical protein
MEDEVARLARAIELLDHNLGLANGRHADAANRIRGLEDALANAGAAANGGGGIHGGGGGGGPNNGGNAGDAADRPPLNPKQPLITFFGREEDDWSSFRVAYINAANFNRFSQTQFKQALLGCMRESAFLAVQNLNHQDDDETGIELLDRYEAKFLPPAASDLARSKFETATQMEKESIIGWHGRVLGLFSRAYGLAGNMGEALLIRAFARGIRNRRVREHCLRSQPQTFDAALAAAQTEQSVLDSSSFIPGAAPPNTTIAGQKVQRTGHRQGGAEPMEIGALSSATATTQCHSCRSYGHFARDCPKRASTTATAGGGNRFKPRTSGGATGKDDKNAKGGKEQRGSKNYRRFINELTDVIQEFNDYSADTDDDGAEAATTGNADGREEDEDASDNAADEKDFC